MNTSEATKVEIKTESDIVVARRAVRDASSAAGFGTTDTTRIVTAASELARNIFKYAGEGTLIMRHIVRADSSGLELEFADSGPGIADLDQAMREGFSSSGGLGMGLPGARRLMDEMEIVSTVGEGTQIVVRKWHRG